MWFLGRFCLHIKHSTLPNGQSECLRLSRTLSANGSICERVRIQVLGDQVSSDENPCLYSMKFWLVERDPYNGTI